MYQTNPLNDMANPSDFAASPFLQAQQAYLKNDLARPLVDAQRKMQMVEQMQALQKMEEWNSPLQKQVREGEATNKIADWNHQAQKRPGELALQGLEIGGKVQDNEKRAEELRRMLQQPQAAGMTAMFTELGNRSQQLKKLPPQAQAMAWEQIIQELQSKNPDWKIPDQFRQFTPNLLANGDIAFQATTNSPANTFTGLQNDLNRKNQAAISAGNNKTSIEVADRNIKAQTERDKKMNAGQQIVELGETLRRTDLNADERSRQSQQYISLMRQQLMNSQLIRSVVDQMPFNTPPQARMDMANGMIDRALENDGLLKPYFEAQRASGATPAGAPQPTHDAKGNRIKQ